MSQPFSSERPFRRTLLFTLLYASEGAPIGFIWWALPALLRSAGVPVVEITALTALVVLPWTFKFTWAPLVDALRSRWWGFRAWILTAQLAMGATLLPLVWLDPIADFPAWRLLILLHAFSAATQDVAIDALAINSVPPHERGLLNGCMQAGMLTGRSLFGGGALAVAAWLGRDWVVAALIAWIWLASLVVLFVREPEKPASSRERRAEFRRHLMDTLRRRTTWLGIAFALVSGAAFEATGQLAGPYLVDRGVSAATIGFFYGVLVVGATIAGALIGGRLSDRWGRLRSIALFLAGIVGAVLLLGAADLGAPAAPALLLALLTMLYVFIGLFTAASYALFMDLTDPRLGGTQFSTYMAATNGCESWSTWTAGRIVGGAGYGAAFIVMGAVSLASLAMLPALRRSERVSTLRPSPTGL